MFKRLFGGPKSDGGYTGKGKNVTERTIDALDRLEENEKNLEKRKSLLEKRMDDEQARAQGFLKAKKKSQAVLALRKKKMFEKELENVDNLILRLSEQRIMLEQQQTTASAISSMQGAALAAKETLRETNVDNVEDVLADINEQNEEHRAIQESLANNVGLAGEFDEDDILAELDEMEQAELDEELLQPAPIPTAGISDVEALPSVPQRTPAKPQKTQEELDLEALEAEMAA